MKLEFRLFYLTNICIYKKYYKLFALESSLLPLIAASRPTQPASLDRQQRLVNNSGRDNAGLPDVAQPIGLSMPDYPPNYPPAADPGNWVVCAGVSR